MGYGLVLMESAIGGVLLSSAVNLSVIDSAYLLLSIPAGFIFSDAIYRAAYPKKVTPVESLFKGLKDYFSRY